MAPEDLRNLLSNQLQLSTNAWSAAIDAVLHPGDATSIIAQLQVMKATAADCAPIGEPLLTGVQAAQIIAGQGHLLRCGSWVIRERVGCGGCAEVLKAYDVENSRIGALKRLRRDRLADVELVQGAALLQRFEREANWLAGIEHPNIVRVLDRNVANTDDPYFVMEYVEGNRLDHVIQRAGGNRPSVGTVVDWLKTLSQVLWFLHTRHGVSSEVIHRDIKPANIVLQPDGTLKLLDFGIARFEEFGTATIDVTIGSPEVMPPEQWDDSHQVTPASDVYSLGCTAFYLLTGQFSFQGQAVGELRLKHCSAPRPHLRSLRSDVPVWLDRVVFKMMAVKPEDRYGSAAELLQALDAGRDDTDGDAAPLALADTEQATVIATSTPRRFLPNHRNRPIKHLELSSLGRPRRIIFDKDGSEMVLVEQQASGFRMGSDDDGPADCRPAHGVYLSDFFIDVHLVTNRQFARFVAEQGAGIGTAWMVHYPNEAVAEYPVRSVTWKDAQRYCEWAGKRLPSEAQWECAATVRGTTTVPWPEGCPDTLRADFCYACDSGAAQPTFVGSRLPNALGLYDFSGNIAEWVDDWYWPDLYKLRSRSASHEKYENGLVVDPRIMASAHTRVVRGRAVGTPPNALDLYLRGSRPPAEHSPLIGFRTVWEPADVAGRSR